MSFLFQPKHVEKLTTEGFSPQEILVLCYETAQKAGYRIIFQSADGLIALTQQSMLSWNAEIRFIIEYNSLTIQSSSANGTYDWGKNKKTVTATINLYQQLAESLTKEELHEKYLELSANLEPNGLDVLAPASQNPTQKISSFLSVFKPQEDYFITPILINLNVLIYIIMVICGVDFMNPSTEDLIRWGANFSPITLEGAWWRLFSCFFLHIGLIHLIMNMVALMYIGLLLEPHLGKIRFLGAYILSGIMASMISLWWHELIVSAGASGAIFGLYGVFLMLLSTDLFDQASRKTLLGSIGFFVAYNLIMGLKSGIDNAAHIGGLLAGIVIGFMYNTFSLGQEEAKQKIKMVSLLSLGFGIICLIIGQGITNNMGIYEAKMIDFAENEKLALELYNKANYLPKESLLYEIKDRGLYYWNENLNIVNELDKLDLPDELQERNLKITTYCKLRIESYQLLYQTVSENTDRYDSRIKKLNQQIDGLLQELK